jgi:hypothetical protein
VSLQEIAHRSQFGGLSAWGNGLPAFSLGQRLAGIVERRLPNKRKQLLYSCAIGIRRKTFDSIGGFDEDFDFLDIRRLAARYRRGRGIRTRMAGRQQQLRKLFGTALESTSDRGSSKNRSPNSIRRLLPFSGWTAIGMNQR